MAKKKTLRIVKKDVAKPASDRSVRIERATNGFMVSSWMKDKEVRYIAKTKKEAMEYASKIFEKF